MLSVIFFGRSGGICKEKTQVCDGIAIVTAIAVNRVHISI